MIDPGATVRSEDVTLLQSASGFIDKVLSDFPIERLKEGDKLPQAVRDRMAKTARELYETRKTNYEQSVSNVKNLANANNIPFTFIGVDFPELPKIEGASAAGFQITEKKQEKGGLLKRFFNFGINKSIQPTATPEDFRTKYKY